MKKTFPWLFALLFAGYSSAAQYYYTDILNNKQVMTELGVLKEKKIKGVKVVSMEADGTESEGFTCQKKINRDFTEVEIYTSTDQSYPNTFISYFDKTGMLVKTADSSEAGATTIDYRYDGTGKLISVNSVKRFATDDDAGDVAEQHLYNYNDAGVPQQMLLIRNRDTTWYAFEADESGNVIIEKNSKTSEVYYYYYDTWKQLTDIVHKYSFQKQLFTESSFEYNEAGQLVKMVSSEKEGAYYFTWRYTYEDGLRTTERCYSKEGKLMGSVEYLYKK